MVAKKHIPSMTVLFKDSGLDIEFNMVEAISPAMLGKVLNVSRRKLREYKAKAYNELRKADKAAEEAAAKTPEGDELLELLEEVTSTPSDETEVKIDA